MTKLNTSIAKIDSTIDYIINKKITIGGFIKNIYHNKNKKGNSSLGFSENPFSSEYNLKNGVLICSRQESNNTLYLAGNTHQKQVYLASSDTVTSDNALESYAIEVINSDNTKYGAGNFPDNYYDEFSRKLYNKALSLSNGSPSAAFSMINKFQNGELGTKAQRHYTNIVGTDNTNGWDKVRHFIFTAFLQYEWNSLSAGGFTYLKEAWDEIESWVDADPEGWSDADIVADNAGKAFATELLEAERKQNQENTRAYLELLKKIFVDQDTDTVIWFIQNFGR
ncbi:MAG TPA: hypothetical protein PKZ97_01940 [Azospirillaceae bacterium]|nr:hypothetical protein [Azospirillaceae bacterium]HRQ79857.1 hypothetical protein [Azospirillaceae bacterium]